MLAHFFPIGVELTHCGWWHMCQVSICTHILHMQTRKHRSNIKPAVIMSLTTRHVLQADRGRQDLPLPPSTTRVAPCTCRWTCWPSRCPTPFASTSTVLQTTCRRQWPVTSCTSTAGTPSLSTPSPATSPLTKSVPRRLATTPYKYRTTLALKPSSSKLPTTVRREERRRRARGRKHV